MDRNYEDLVQAIVVQAAKDYRKTLKRLIKYPRDRDAKYHKDEIEEFFRSDWFMDMTTADGEYITALSTAMIRLHLFSGTAKK